MLLKLRRLLPIIVGLVASSLACGCTDFGTPDYSSHEGLVDPVDPFPPVPPDPFQPGDERLSVGYFYEGGWSVEIPINQVNTNYFIFAADPNNVVPTLTFNQTTSSDRMEGLESVEIELVDQPFWGGGIIWDDPIDLSEWRYMFVGFKSSDASFASFELSLQWGEGETTSSVALDPADYGYVNDGEWHFLEIPIQDAIDRGFDPSVTRAPFIISAPGGRARDTLLVDNLYFTKEPLSPSSGGGGTGGTGGSGGTGGTGGSGGTGGTGGSGVVVYEQDFNQLDINAEFIGDGWVYFITAFADPTYGYSGDAPNGPQISALVDDQGGPEQEPQQLSVYSDYENQDHVDSLIETNVFQEPFDFNNRIPEDEVGSTYTFAFDAKRGNIGGSSAASAFIKTLDPDADFSESAADTVDTTDLPDTWVGFTLSLEITSDLVGHLLQFGFQTRATNFEPSGNFYDNVVVTKSGGGSGGELRPLPEIYTTGKAINYSPYRAEGPEAQPPEMPSDEDVLEDLGLLQTAGYNLLRLFGGDAVSEQILQLAEANYPNMRFQQGLFLEGLAPGAAQENCESELNDNQVATAIRLANTYSNVVTVSVGNETSFFGGFMPVDCLAGYISETRNAVTQPVTADDDYSFYAGTGLSGDDPDPILPLIDFASIHMYPITYYQRWDWKQEGVPSGPTRAEAMMNEALAEAQRNYQAVYDYEYQGSAGTMVTIGESMPIVVGETGWKWRQTSPSQEIETYAADPVNAKWYYDLMLGWERSTGGPPTIFIFQTTDEAWKTTDDGWGFWDEARMPLYILCDTPAGTACNDPVYEGAGFFP